MSGEDAERSVAPVLPRKRISRRRYYIVLLVVVALTLCGLGVLAFVHYRHKPGPHIPVSQIPSTLPLDVTRAVRGLYSEDPEARAQACMFFVDKAKAGYVATNAVPFIADLLDDEEQYGRNLLNQYMPAESAVLALRYMGEPGLLALLKASESKDTTVRYHSIFGLGRFWQDQRALAALERLSADKDRRIRRDAWGDLYNIRRLIDSRRSGQSAEPVIVGTNQVFTGWY